MSLTGTAKQTLEIVETGGYTTSRGNTVDLRGYIETAVRGTRLYSPDEVGQLLSMATASRPFRHNEETVSPRFEVTAETTSQAARRLFEQERAAPVLALNFASAKNPGGGFLGGAKAQEEDLARASALYTCQLTQRGYYDSNRAERSALYTDYLIYSPDVPFFRDDRLALLDAPFLVSVITSPAPNAGAALRDDPASGGSILETLERRAGQVLVVAASKGHRTLVLGAWGCGVFRNQPGEVARVFHTWLTGVFRGAFERVVFAVYDRAPGHPNRTAFERHFL